MNVWLTLAPAPVVPSPKSHEPSAVLVKVNSAGAVPDGADAAICGAHSSSKRSKGTTPPLPDPPWMAMTPTLRGPG